MGELNFTIENVPVGESTYAGTGSKRGQTWDQKFDTIPIGGSFVLQRGTDEEKKWIRNVRIACTAYNKRNNLRRMIWSTHKTHVRFGPIHGPGAETVTPGE